MRSRAHVQSHPIHPMLIVFPIGLWIGGFIFDLLGIATGRPLLWAAGYYCILGGIAGALLAAIPGVIDLFSVVPPHSSGRRRGYIHGALNITVTLIFVYLAFRRGSPVTQPDTTVLLIAAGALVLLGVSGWLGGTLVYRNQIGVDHRYANAGKFRERFLSGWDQPVCNTGELGDGQMMLAHVGSERVVVGRCGTGEFVAFSDHCTHRGGPLSDGALVGCVVQCPWHGSQFDVRTGRVVAGPAPRKIYTYDVEIRNNEVFVMASMEERELKPGDAPPGEEPGFPTIDRPSRDEAA